MLNGSSKELLDSINDLRKSMDMMLKLFTEAAEEIKSEGSEGPAEISSMNEKLDKVLDQNREIIELIGNFTEKREKPLMHKPNIKSDFQHLRVSIPNSQQPPGPMHHLQQPSKSQFNEQKLPELDDLQPSQQFDQPSRHDQQGPVAMPSIPFPSFKEPKKKGLFERLRR